MGDDGHIGLSDIKQHGGSTVAQSVETCVYPNLTQCAIEQGVVDYVLSTDQLPIKIQELTKSVDDE